MAIRTGTIRGRHGRVAALLMLTPMMILNASQAMTLCVSRDGHVAVELLVQDRCVCNTPASESRGFLVDATLDITDGRDLSCTDLAMPPGACSTHPTLTPSKAAAIGLATIPPALPSAITDMSRDNAHLPSPAPVCYHAPLNSIVLQV